MPRYRPTAPSDAAPAYWRNGRSVGGLIAAGLVSAILGSSVILD